MTYITQTRELTLLWIRLDMGVAVPFVLCGQGFQYIVVPTASAINDKNSAQTMHFFNARKKSGLRGVARSAFNRISVSLRISGS